jgi:hypothetical protein
VDIEIDAKTARELAGVLSRVKGKTDGLFEIWKTLIDAGYTYAYNCSEMNLDNSELTYLDLSI